MVEDKDHMIGSRILCDGYCGTLKYVGPVENTKGIWLGIDWDDFSRGKHGGTYKDVEYFKTWHPNSGSFVRLEKVKFGISCPDAIKMKYGLVNDDLAGIDRNKLSSLQKEINAPFMEMVGFSKVNKKQSKFENLEVVCLRGECVSNAGDPDELIKLSPNITELDLSKNLICSWKAVAEIVSQLVHLKRLNVSENNLIVDEEELNELKHAFTSVTDLTMTKMNYTSNDVNHCINIFPGLKILSVSFNLIKELQEFNCMKLTSLTLEENEIHCWDEILKLGCLPCLESINLNCNKLLFIRFPIENSNEKTNYFSVLKQMHISNNNISEWNSVSELDKLKCLEDLKFRENPILRKESFETTRQLIIARISNLKLLNSTEIFYTERSGAENDYLKMFAKEWIESENDSEKRIKFLNNHPRYPALVQIFIYRIWSSGHSYLKNRHGNDFQCYFC
ncbi:tubulin-specific chaperone E isoform X2 [Leptopilina boulardi]|uniref:tubulin-specific chaperone E isoform X2 n=1 Tax=Leptopilina boulardi TaxID=63433 RepID=UPI0021F53473|nr:tubulin-specific chaperone E isoform X2 [Leptopilina boulardi]